MTDATEFWPPEARHPLPLAPAELTTRQQEIVELVARGWTDKRIAGHLGIEYNTVRVHVAAIAYRLCLVGDLHTRVAIARWWFEMAQAA
jgi:DNA-binding NarL/FixJ family response regulator